MNAPGTIIFAIRAGLQLSGALRKAYVDATIGRPLVLPLPRSAGIDHTSAITWFTGSGAEAAAKFPRVGELLHKPDLTGEDKAELTAPATDRAKSILYDLRAIAGPADQHLREQISAMAMRLGVE